MQLLDNFNKMDDEMRILNDELNMSEISKISRIFQH